uniref:FG-GAP repeat-containing protein n=1 Tax=Aegilops tauschii subsp. strangulata TaxID=200361 RepID=A0A453MNQ3_AEGTS
MRKRDLGILLLAAFAVFFSLQHEGDFSFREAWYHLSDDGFPIKHDADRLPPPLVADLNGDGRREVLLPTHDAKIQVLQLPAHAGLASAAALDGFHEARVMAEISLLPANVRVAAGRRPVAMAVGAVDRSYKHAEVRKQVLVVVTSGWAVMCFDHNLKKLWETSLGDDFPHAAHHREVAVSVTNYTLKHGDAGLVIVGGRMEMQHHLHLTEGGLHADINGDGVLDHVQVVGGNGAEQTVVSGSMEVLKPCWAVATSGVPVREQLFNVSICHYNHLNLFHHGDFSRSFGRSFDPSGLEVATPVLLERDDGHKHRRGSHGDIIFLTSRGEVTSYTPGLLGHDAMWRWQLSTGATWSNLPSPSGMMENVVVPTLKTFSLRAYDPKQVIIAGGDQEAVVISPDGSLLTSIDLPAPPTHALILEDFSGDGLTDVILVTSGGVYGFVQTRQPGALFFSTLVGFLIVVIGVIFVSLHLNSSNGGKPRSNGQR